MPHRIADITPLPSGSARGWRVIRAFWRKIQKGTYQLRVSFPYAHSEIELSQIKQVAHEEDDDLQLLM